MTVSLGWSFIMRKTICLAYFVNLPFRLLCIQMSSFLPPSCMNWFSERHDVRMYNHLSCSSVAAVSRPEACSLRLILDLCRRVGGRSPKHSGFEIVVSLEDYLGQVIAYTSLPRPKGVRRCSSVNLDCLNSNEACSLGISPSLMGSVIQIIMPETGTLARASMTADRSSSNGD